MPKSALNPRKQPKQERSRFTVEAIVEATFRVLADGGITELSTTRVAQRAGVSVGTLYQYFPTKEALLEEVLKRHVEQMRDVLLRSSQQTQGSPIEARLRDAIAIFVSYKRSVPSFLRTLAAHTPAQQGFTRKASTADLACQLLEEIIRDSCPTAPPGRAELAAFVITHAVEGVLSRALSHSRMLYDGALEDTLVCLAVSVLRSSIPEFE